MSPEVDSPVLMAEAVNWITPGEASAAVGAARIATKAASNANKTPETKRRDTEFPAGCFRTCIRLRSALRRPEEMLPHVSMNHASTFGDPLGTSTPVCVAWTVHPNRHPEAADEDAEALKAVCSAVNRLGVGAE